MELKRYQRSMICPKCNSIQIVSDYNKQLDVITRRCTECSYAEDQLPLDRIEKERNEQKNS